jgi:hypothetical protein
LLHDRLDLQGDLRKACLWNKQPRARDASLAAVLKCRGDRCGNGSCKICIVQNEGGRLAAKAQRDALHRFQGCASDELTGAAGAGEGNSADVRMRAERGPNDLAASAENIDHARRQPSFMQRFGHDPGGRPLAKFPSPRWSEANRRARPSPLRRQLDLPPAILGKGRSHASTKVAGMSFSGLCDAELTRDVLHPRCAGERPGQTLELVAGLRAGRAGFPEATSPVGTWTTRISWPEGLVTLFAAIATARARAPKKHCREWETGSRRPEMIEPALRCAK